MTTYLVDMDGVIADVDAYFYHTWDALYPEDPLPEFEGRGRSISSIATRI